VPKERCAEADGDVQFAALKRPVVPTAPATITLPKTATNAELSMLLGLGILMLELIWLIAIRRRTAN